MTTARPSSRAPHSSTTTKAHASDPLAALLAASTLTGTERVLDIGSLDGARAAELSLLVSEVVSLEGTQERADERARTLAALGRGNVRVVVGPAMAGWLPLAPYQLILIGAGVCDLPTSLLDQLDEGGKLLIPLGGEGGQVMELLEKHATGVTARALGPCHLAMLPGEHGVRSRYPWAG